MMFHVALVIFAVSYAYYFERSLSQWPFISRWMRYFYFNSSDYPYNRKEVIMVGFIGIMVYIIIGLYLFFLSIKIYNTLGPFFQVICIFGYLFIPSLLFHLIRGLCQFFPYTDMDFIKAKKESDKRDSKVNMGMSNYTANIIKIEINKGQKRKILNRILISTFLLALFYIFLPAILGFISKTI